MRLTSPGMVTRILSCTFLVTFVVINWNFNSAQGHVLRSAHRLLADIEGRDTIISQSNSEHEPEIAQIKFITGLRHKRDLSQRDYHIIQVHRPSKNSTTVIHLHRKTTIVSDNFKIIIKNGEDVKSETLSSEDVDTDCLYHGTIPSDPEGKVALSTCGEHFGFSGLVMSKDEHWLIEPHPVQVKSLHESLEVPHVIQTVGSQKTAKQCGSDKIEVPLDDLKNATKIQTSSNGTPYEETNEVSSDNEISVQNTMIGDGLSKKKTSSNGSGQIETLATKSKGKKGSSKSKSSAKQTVEIAVFTDADFYSKMKTHFPKGTDNAIKSYVLTMINAMDLLYEQSSLGSSLVFRLVYLEVQQKWPSALSNSHNGKGSKYIDAFCRYAGDLNNHLWDHALMLTGMDLEEDGSTAMAGLAYAGTMCYRYYSCSVSEGTNLGTVYVITHEIGHSVGMEHDGEGVSSKCDKEKNIMSPTTGPGKLTWSTCSAQNLKEFMQYGTSEPTRRSSSAAPGCLSVLSKGSKTIEYASSTLPGQKYDSNTQCILSSGKKPYLVKSGAGSNICAMLYCTDGKTAISSHPALEGTTCNKGKWCRAGQCVTKK